jgi:MFS family permease
MDADEQRNAWKCTIGEGLFGVGTGCVGALTVLPLLLASLGASDFAVGLGGSIAMAGWGLLQPVSVFLLGGRRRTQRFLIPWSFSFAVPTYLAMAAAVYLLARGQPRLCSMLLLVLLGVRVFGAGATIPFWFDWQAMVFRQAIRGRVIGMMAGASALGFSVGAFAAGLMQGALGFPLNYACLFLIAAGFFVVALLTFWSVREPDSLAAPYYPLRPRELVSRFGRSLGERNFRNYLIGRALLALGGGSAVFYSVHFHSSEGGGLAADMVFKLGTVVALSQSVASYLLGRLGDRVGHKAGIVIGALAQFASIAVAFLGTGPAACAVSFALLGVSGSAAWVSHQNMLFETCPHESRVAHITLSTIVLQPFFFLVPMATGWMMDNLPTRATGIGLTLIPTLMGIAWLAWMVQDPRTTMLSRTDLTQARAA